MITLFGILVGFSFWVSIPTAEQKDLFYSLLQCLFHTLSSISVGIAAGILLSKIGS